MLGHRHSVFCWMWTKKHIALTATSSHPMASGELALELWPTVYTEEYIDIWRDETMIRPLHCRINMPWSTLKLRTLQFHQIKDTFYCLNQFDLGLLLLALKILIHPESMQSPNWVYSWNKTDFRIIWSQRWSLQCNHLLFIMLLLEVEPEKPVDCTGLPGQEFGSTEFELTFWSTPYLPYRKKTAVSEHLTNNVHPWFISSHSQKKERKKKKRKRKLNLFNTLLLLGNVS